MTPADQGFRAPAEWSPHAAVWTAWPHGLDEPRALVALCTAIADRDPATGEPRGERIEMIVRPQDEEAADEQLEGTPVRFRHLRRGHGDVRVRDTGPIFIARTGEVAAATFRFDGWGGKRLLPGDAQLATAVAQLAEVREVAHDFVLEGCAVEVDGAGTLMTTRQCLLAGCRNPGTDAREMEVRLRDALGAEQVVWIDRGLEHDHGDGHVDTIARFVAPGVVVCMEPALGDANRDALREVLGTLRAARDAAGRRLELFTVPSPHEVRDASGVLLPASYLTFYIARTTVVVPTYGVAADDAALARLAPLFPDRRLVAVPARALLAGGATFHGCALPQP